MATTRRTIPADPSVVYAALTTPETYPLWLVGCQHIRAVDDGWPEPGTSFHHRVGLVGGVTVADSTSVVEAEVAQRLVLEVRARPLGRGRVEFVLTPGSPGTTVVTLTEEPIGLAAPARPVLDPLTEHRNARSLERLGALLVADRALRSSVP